MKLSKLIVITGVLFLSMFLGCTQDEITIEKSPLEQGLFSVPDIKETKEAFINNNQKINLISGIKNDAQILERNANTGYVINWEDSKQTAFKENVDVLYTPVVMNFVSRKQKSFIASVKNKGKIESVLFTVYYAPTSNATSFTGYISKFTIKGKFIALYKYNKGILEKKMTPKKKKTTRQQRSKEKECPPITKEYIEIIIEMLEESGGGSVTLLGCTDVTKEEESDDSGGGSGGSSRTGHGNWHSLKKLYTSKIGSNMQGGGRTPSVGGGAGSAGSSTPGINTNWWGNTNNDAPDTIINNLKGKADCVYGKMVDNNNNINWILKNFEDGRKPSEFNLRLEMSTSLGDLTNATTVKSGNTFIIKINQNTLSEKTPLGLARTILHEGIHARLREFAVREGSNRTSFPGVYDYFRRFEKNWDHQQMAAHYRKTIAQGLKQYDKGRHSDAFYNALAWEGLSEVKDLNGNQDKIYTEAWKKLSHKEQKKVLKIITKEKKNGNKTCQ